MRLFRFLPLSLVLLGLIVSGCGSALPGVVAQPESPSPVVTTKAGSPAPVSTETIATDRPPDIIRDEPIVAEIIARAMADLTERLGIAKDEILVVNVKDVTWPDASLGCPQPGMAYAQVVTPGYLIVLEASGEHYRYHTNLGTNIVLCQDEALPSFPVTPGEIDDGEPWMPVD